MKNLRFVCVQPRLIYYAWQVEVMINNFLKNGINPNNIDICVAWNPGDETSSARTVETWEKLSNHYRSVRFFFYQDTRIQPIKYISSIRPNILKQHFKNNPQLKDEAIFYHDCDMIFTKQNDWSKFLHDNIWYLSDTNSYINHTYITSKGEDVYNLMCEIVGMNPLIPKLMNSNSGGAQYILKNVDHLFWEKVEIDCEELYFRVNELNNEKKKQIPNYHELQIWCADMWSVLWNGWLRGNETKVVTEMDFSWATDSETRFYETNIFHNAGVVSANDGKFYKADFRESLPYNVDLDITEGTASYIYFQEIQETAKKSPLTSNQA
jgi:hypothetical protein